MAGDTHVHDALPYFWSEQYGLTLQMFGRPQEGDELLLRPGASPSRFTALWLARDSSIAAAAGMDAAGDLSLARRLIERRTPVSADAVRDPAIELRALARPQVRS
ncbi:oxidoreductase C-terminal domain-containing protein [Streptomyces vastus]|uniref:oxidoreductase C-terminal domain-containing protein n=1 Tax=Streptomyces vastus TaxID=285451 RepID=UPI003CD08B65